MFGELDYRVVYIERGRRLSTARNQFAISRNVRVPQMESSHEMRRGSWQIFLRLALFSPTKETAESSPSTNTIRVTLGIEDPDFRKPSDKLPGNNWDEEGWSKVRVSDAED